MLSKSLKFLLEFLVGGCVVLGTTEIAHNFSTKWASLFFAFPWSLIIVLIFMHYNKTSTEKISQFLLGTSISLVMGIIFIVSYGLLLKKYTLSKSGGIATGIFMVFAVIYIITICPSPFADSKNCIKL